MNMTSLGLAIKPLDVVRTAPNKELILVLITVRVFL